MRNAMIKSRAPLLILCFCCGAIFAGCGKSSPAPAEKNILRVYAGAGLRRGISAASAKFAEKNGIEVDIDFGGSGIILNRAATSGGCDLFLPGDVWYVNELQRKTGMLETRAPVAKFIPVLVVVKGNPKRIHKLEDLFRNDVKTALGNPDSCQIGRISKAIFRKNGLDSSKLSAKLGLTVNELGVWARMRDVDAAVVWDAVAANIADDVEIIRIPEGRNIISTVSIALLKNARNKRSALKFIDFITKGEGRGIMKSNGYSVYE